MAHLFASWAASAAEGADAPVVLDFPTSVWIRSVALTGSDAAWRVCAIATSQNFSWGAPGEALLGRLATHPAADYLRCER